jgi:hypothetical protein
VTRPDTLLAGRRLGGQEAARLLHDAGFHDRNLVVMLAVADAEADRYTEATHENDDGSIDRGWLQINSVWVTNGVISEQDCFDPAKSAAFAYQLFLRRNKNFSAWAAYTSGRWEEARHLRVATRGFANMFRDDYDLPRLVDPAEP